jgi:hypothetical protein
MPPKSSSSGKLERRVSISATTVTEALAAALDNVEALLPEGFD